MCLADEEFDRLNELWRCLYGLSTAEWNEAITLVSRCLSKYGFSEYGPLKRAGREPADLIIEFCSDRILIPARERADLPRHINRAWLYRRYKWYLKSQLRQLGQEPQNVKEPDEIPVPDDPSFESIVSEYGLTPEQIIDAALDFLAARGRWKHLAGDLWWIRPYLAEHHCPPKDRSIPLRTLAGIYDVPNRHNKAAHLGITAGRHGFESYADFERTLLGQWIGSLVGHNKPDSPNEMQPFVSVALQIMCRAALIYEGMITRRRGTVS